MEPKHDGHWERSKHYSKWDWKAAIWEAILSDIMLQTEKFILSLTITPKQIENKTLVPSARQQKKKTVFKLTELILDEGWSGHKSDDTYRDFNKST